MLLYIKRLWLKAVLHYRGIRFYQTDIVPKSPEFRSAEFMVVGGHTVEFFFFKDECVDLIFKRGRISKEQFIGIVIQARFTSEAPPMLSKYNNLKFFFNTKNIFVSDEIEIASALLEIYIRFIENELKANHVP